MPLVKIRYIDQGDFIGKVGYSSGGICYYMSNYVEKSSDLWLKPGSYENAVKIAEKFLKIQTIVSFAKAQNTIARGGSAIPQTQYTWQGALQDDKIYRMGLWFGATAENPDNADHQNHEGILVTGTSSQVVFFEPNWGFYKSESGVNKTEMETGINQLYTTIGMKATNFFYKKIRGANSSSPLSFST